MRWQVRFFANVDDENPECEFEIEAKDENEVALKTPALMGSAMRADLDPHAAEDWLVFYGTPQTLAEQIDPPSSIINVYTAIAGRQEALKVAKRLLDHLGGYTVWSIRDFIGNVVMDQDEVWRAVFGDAKA